MELRSNTIEYVSVSPLADRKNVRYVAKTVKFGRAHVMA